MSRLGGFIQAVTAGAMLCGLLLSLPQEGTQKELVRLVTACALTLCVLAPFRGLETNVDFDWQSWQSVGEDWARQGENAAREAAAERIRAALAAYILDKARALGLTLEAEVTLDEQNLPQSVRLTGSAAPYPRQRLEELLTRELGIAKEKLEWIG